jgi:hypothetical protein
MTRVLIPLALLLLTSCSHISIPPQFVRADAKLLRQHVDSLVYDEEIRNFANIYELDRVASYIKKEMELIGLNCEYQEYTLNVINPDIYRNVICKLNANQEKTFILGAHYDVCEYQEGADDNASGVSGLIETARLLYKNRLTLTHNIEFVAYTLEEPPYFRTQNMGSFRHAQSIKDSIENYAGMISIEMIGYYSTRDIQEYPFGIGWLYPSHGNFIAAVGNFSSDWISEDYQDAMESIDELETQKLSAPSFITGIDFSDHLNYWTIGMDAIMITDTAFMRNKNYHETSDQISTLDFKKMSFVINGITLLFLDNTK